VRLLALVLAIGLSASAHAKPARVLRVCADPNNFPFTDEHTPGFENEIADVLAKHLHARVEYTWWAQRRGFFRNTLNARSCDLVIGVPAGLGMARTTRPYYRSAFAFVTRADRKLAITSFEDQRLQSLKIGVQLVGDDGRNSPPAHALAARGIIDNVSGFTSFGDYSKPAPEADILRAVERGTIDVAVVWGPLAGAYAKRAKVKLVVTPIAEASDHDQQMQFDIAAAVPRKDDAFAKEIDAALAARHRDILAILDRWGVPHLDVRPREAKQ
jgi:quinoprotein dehydrogenase-associated probable ABC transporter substrate-binding protein